MLHDYRVIELGMWVAGPGAGGVLADWGADVVKVETPVGDPMRRIFKLLAGHGQPESPPFDLDNRGKRSVVVDLATPDGGAIV
ncbi:MAG TPA: CoA transferase, partial [Acidimicrobiales bacterium]